MRAQIVAMTSENLDMDAIKRAGDILKAGGLVAFPTETVYGLGGNALDPQASMKIYAAKGRPSDNPLIVHIAEAAEKGGYEQRLISLQRLRQRFHKVQRFWRKNTGRVR